MASTLRLFSRMNGWVPIIALVIGLGVMAFGGYNISTGEALKAQEIGTTATVTRKYTQQTARSSGGHRSLYKLVITYETPQGQIQNTANATAAFYNSHQPGDQIEIFYLPDTPETFEFSQGETTRTGWSIVLAGGVIFAGGAGLLGFFLKRAARAARLLQHGRMVEGTITEVVKMRGGAYLGFRFTPESGAVVIGKSLSRASKYFAGLKEGQPISVVYDPEMPEFAFWQADLA
jgi:hypothetical protein